MKKAATEKKAGEFLRAICPTADWDSDPELAETPRRFVQMLRELTTPEDFNFTTFDNYATVNGDSELVTVRDISFVSLCKHHIAPFVGVAHIGYIPGDKIAGLSKFARSVRWWSKGLWTQEELTHAIAGYLDDELDPAGIAVRTECEHMCMTIRGVQAPGTKTVCTQLRGLFLNPATGRDPKGEFLESIRH